MCRDILALKVSKTNGDKSKASRNMQYSDSIAILDNYLSKDGYKQIAPAFFSKKISSNSFSWISVPGNNFMLSPSIGIVFPHLIKIMYRFLADVFPESKQHHLSPNLGPPIVIIPLQVISGSAVPPQGENTPSDDGITLNIIDSIYASIIDFAYPFFVMNSDINSAIESAYIYSKFGEAQKYIIPIALAETKQLGEFVNYSRACLSAFSTRELSDSYAEYLNVVARHFNFEIDSGGLASIERS